MEHFDLTHIVILLAAGVLIVPIFHRLGLGSVLGYLIAGVMVGPWGFSVITQVEEIQHFAEFGVVFLLFVIGIELNFKRLWTMKRLVFGLGSAQVIITGCTLAAISHFALGLSEVISIVIGFGLSLSSTAFGLQILSERNSINTATGRTSFSILLLQDLSIVPLLALVSFLAKDSPLVQGIEFALLNTLLVIIAVIITGRYVLTPVLRAIAKSHNSEIFVAASILAVLGTAWLMQEIGLSMVLGAFLAGLMLADSYYRHQIIADIQPFRGLLLGLFFMSVGMSVDFGLLQQSFLPILGLICGLLLVKTCIIWVLCTTARLGHGVSIHTALMLSQSGEFGFVLFGLASAEGILSQEISQMLTLIIALSMATTPLMAILGEKIESLKTSTHKIKNNHPHTKDEYPAVVIAGFGRVGKRVAKILKQAEIPYIALDNDPDCVAHNQKSGFNITYGDAGRYDVLNRMGASHAGIFLVTLDDPLISEKLVSIMRLHYPDKMIYARGHDRHHCEKLTQAGAIAISETLEASLTLSRAALEATNVDEGKISHYLTDFRKSYYTNPAKKDA